MEVKRQPVTVFYLTGPGANQRRQAENDRVRNMRYALEDPEEDKQRVVAEWEAWYAEVDDRFELGTGEQLRTLFFETRFARYWANLIRLDFGVSIRRIDDVQVNELIAGGVSR